MHPEDLIAQAAREAALQIAEERKQGQVWAKKVDERLEALEAKVGLGPVVEPEPEPEQPPPPPPPPPVEEPPPPPVDPGLPEPEVLLTSRIMGVAAKPGVPAWGLVGFPEGLVWLHELVGVRTKYGKQMLESQMKLNALHGDGSVQSLNMQVLPPPLEPGEILDIEFVRGTALESTELPEQLEASLIVYNSSGEEFEVSSFDRLRSIWAQGSLVRALRMEEKVPARVAVVGGARVIVDFHYFQDGTAQVVGRIANDAFFKEDGGPSPSIGLKIVIGGQVALDVAPKGLLQYASLSFWASRRPEGEIVVSEPIGPFFMPYMEDLWKSGLSNYLDESQVDTTWANDSGFRDPVRDPRGVRVECLPIVEKIWNERQGRDNTADELWAHRNGIGDVGGRMEIGDQKGTACVAWLTGDWRARELELRGARVGFQRPFSLFDADEGVYLDYRKWRSLTMNRRTATAWGTPPEQVGSYPPGQVPQDDDQLVGFHATIGLEVDGQHDGSEFAAAYIMTGWQIWADGLAAQAVYANACWGNRYNGLDPLAVTSGERDWRKQPQNYLTGAGIGHAPRNFPAYRAFANCWRDMLDARVMLPESYPRREMYDELAVGWAAPLVHRESEERAYQGEMFGCPITEKGWFTAYQANYIYIYGAPGTLSTRPGFEIIRRFMEILADQRARQFTSDVMPWRWAAAGFSLRTEPTRGVPITTFAEQVAWCNTSPETTKYPILDAWWDPSPNEKDYVRVSYIALQVLLSLDWLEKAVRARLAKGLGRFRDERTTRGSKQQHMPAILPTEFMPFYTPNGFVAGAGISHRMDWAPVIPSGQVLESVLGDKLAGVIRFRGSVPRSSQPGLNDAWTLLQGPEAGSIELDRGVVEWVNQPPPGDYKIKLRASSWDGPMATPVLGQRDKVIADEGVEYIGPVAEVTLRVR